MARRGRKKKEKKRSAPSINPASAASMQKHLPFSEIRGGTVIMKDGTLRRILMVSSVNFALKSEDEQNGIIQGYVQFLNGLEFELQIVIQSRKLNIENYLDKLTNLASGQNNQLLRQQTLAYRDFVETLVEDADIMDKKFFVVVPYSPFSKKRKSFFRSVQDFIVPARIVQLSQDRFKEYTVELDRRIGQVSSGLSGIGLAVQQLDTQALIELYYNTYNPVSKQQRRIEDIDKMQIDWTVE